MVPELSFAAALLGASVLAGITLWLLLACRPLETGLRQTAGQLQRTAAWRAEVTWWLRASARLAQWQKFTEATIGGSTQAVRSVHFGVAAIPFSILEAIPVTRDTTRLVRGVHNLTANAVYGAIGAVNQWVGLALRAANGSPGQPESLVSGGAASKPPSVQNKALTDSGGRPKA